MEKIYIPKLYEQFFQNTVPILGSINEDYRNFIKELNDEKEKELK